MTRMRFGGPVSIDEEIAEAEAALIEAAETLTDLKKQREKERPPRPSDCLTPDEIADIERD